MTFGEKLKQARKEDEIKEAINLAEFEKVGNCRCREDAAVFAKYAEADAITPLIRLLKEPLLFGWSII
jgi:hypothetical protein